MQPLKYLSQTLADLANAEHYLFTTADLRGALPDLAPGALRALLRRAERAALLRRVCRGVYLYERVEYPRGLVLFHAAARLRADGFNYLSLETVLSDAGVISQVPINWITLMSSGRSSVIRCGIWGTIEFVHTRRRPSALRHWLAYDRRCRLWRANVTLAIKDMQVARRNTDLIDWKTADELV
ncbi:MAG: hypothetical protein PF501_18405 [Salinisphaera sp.]|jgi:hypothetical protein|nr:hypothetical protein [Salinisphaera sp.]